MPTNIFARLFVAAIISQEWRWRYELRIHLIPFVDNTDIRTIFDAKNIFNVNWTNLTYEHERRDTSATWLLTTTVQRVLIYFSNLAFLCILSYFVTS